MLLIGGIILNIKWGKVKYKIQDMNVKHKKKFEDSKEETRSRKLKNDKQCNDQKDKKTNKGQLNTIQKTKHRATRTNTENTWWTRLLRKG